MRKNLGKETIFLPLPVLILGTYDKQGRPNAMNAAWGGIYDYNQIFLVDDIYLYLYVDIISFYNNKDLQKLTNKSGYYEEFISDNKKGYILVEETGEQYFLSIVYNYSKIEGYVPKEKINKIITLSSIILNSIEYNENVIEKILEGDLGQFSEFTYEVEKPEGASSNFSQYLEEYVQKDNTEEIEKLPDE